MSDSGLRKRNKNAASQKLRSEKSKNSVTRRQGKSTSSRSVFFVLLSAVAFFAYQNVGAIRTYVRRYIHRWSGMEDVGSLTAPSHYQVDFTADVPKRDAVVAAFKHAWHAYERDAMGADEYHPISHQGTNLSEAGGIGYTVVDSIDTIILMGLGDEFWRAQKWIAEKMSFDRDGSFNTFETTIRVLGGLLSAFHLTNDRVFLARAKELADRILPVFDTPSGLPLSMINLATRQGISDKDNNGLVSTAEVSTLQLELKYLSLLTNEPIYWEKAEKVMQVIKAARTSTGLASIFLNPEDGRFALSAIRLGSRGDSYYEYLLKQYLQTNLTEPVYRDMYADAMNGVHDHLIQKSYKANLIYTSELIPERNRMGDLSWRLTPKQDHLVCFFGGSLMLGAVTTEALVYPVSIPPRAEQLTPVGQRDWATGVELVRTCMKTHDTATGLSPEIVYFRIPSDNLGYMMNAPDDWYIKGARPGVRPPYDARYILRPETVESLFIAYRLTGDPRYREYGWNIFQAIEKHCRVESGGYASVLNVDSVPVELEDKMETFLMSETLKYLFLLFEDASVLPLSKYVFNTEAHAFPIFNPTIRTGFS